MELVYLWVEEYKNIKNQGFNFSPRFTCKYEDGELTIDKKEHVSIFPDNINVTAIVGENGSGKSSILVEILNQAKNINSFFCFYDNDKKEIISNIKVNQKSKISNVLKISDNYDSVKNFLNTPFFYHYKNDTDLPILDNDYAIYNEKGFIFTEPNKNNNQLDIKIEEEKTLKKIIHLVRDNFYEKMNTDEFFVPRTVELKVDDKRVKEAINILDENREDKILHNYEYFKNTLTKKESLLLQNIFYFYALYNGYGGASLNNENLLNFNYEVLKNDIDKVKDEISRFHEQIIEQSYDEQINSQLNKLIDSNMEINKRTMQLKELQKSFNLFKNIDTLIDLWQKSKDGDSYTEWVLIDKLKNDTNIELLQNLPRFLKINFWTPHKGYYYNLSSGEKSFLELLYSVREIVSLRANNRLSNNIFILLDEIENSLHPQWQKGLIFGLISFIKTYNINIHIIVATHSPYVLSDLPKENVIFLEKGKQVYPFENKQTFGANIHTLLSHGFFMKDGLMGEFAKEKINDAIKYLNKKSLSKEEIDYCENIISIIGEPILKNQLQRMLNSKRLSKVDKIDKLEEELELIKHRIEMIRKNQ